MHISRNRPAFLVVAIIAATLAVTSLLVANRGGAEASTGPASVDEPVFPRPGGGPRAIHGLIGVGREDPSSYLLDPATGEYRQVPYEHAILSPDGRRVAVTARDGRVGVANRRALLRAGADAVRWTGLPAGVPMWSPDGMAVLVNTIDKGSGPPGEFAAHRYDLATGRVRTTPIDQFDCSNCFVGWAADSVRYVVMRNGADPAAGPMQYVDPDGSPGRLVGAEGHIWDADAYSPTRRYVIIEPSRPDPAATPPTIFDLRTGTAVTTVDTAWPLVGWYDRRSVVRVVLEPGEGSVVLEVIDIHTGEIGTRVPAPGLPPYRLQVRTSRGLSGDASELGF